MAEHFSQGKGIYTAAVYGDLDLAREWGRQLAEAQSSPALPEGSAGFAAALRDAARAIERAPTLETVALATGPLAQRCVACHQAFDVRPGIETSARTPTGNTLPAHMARHRWVLDRLWEGIIARSDALWQRGVDGLRERPLDESELRARGGAAAVALGDRIHEETLRAEDARTAAARAAAFGRILAACVECHAAAPEWPSP